jgi:two-component system, OmpR family, alkaline phosphatase synthesis response regulator PhoP
MAKICVVEDEVSILEMVRMNLELEGYQVQTYTDGKIALDAIQANSDFDLLILDVMLPSMNGLDICKEVRKNSKIPILILSAKGTTTDRIQGLKLGANDYLPKPFDLEELLLRVQNLIGAKTELETTLETIEIGQKQIDFSTFLVKDKQNQESTSLSKKEIELLKLFIEKEGKVVSRDEILDRVWGKDSFPTSRTIDNFILNFRKLFEKDPKHPQHFLSIRGVGYKFLG